jgi:hypothetical protein
MAGAGGLIFELDACAVIAEHSKGVPANINGLCVRALQTGFERNLKRINVELVESVIRRDQLLSDSIIVERPELLHRPRIAHWIFWFVILFLTIVVGANLWYHVKKRPHRSDAAAAVAAPLLLKHDHGTNDQPAFAARSRNSPTSAATPTKLDTTRAAIPATTFKSAINADRQSKVREESANNQPPIAKSTGVRTSEAVLPSQASGAAGVSDKQLSLKIGAADTHMRLGEYDSAIDVLRRALILVPNNPDIERRIRRARRAKIAEENALQGSSTAATH